MPDIGPLAALGCANPFAGTARAWSRAARAIRGWTPTSLRREARSESLLRRALLARAHVGALDESGGAALPVPFDPLLAQVGLARTDVGRVAAAAARCHRALERLRGSSELMQQLRARVWAACFGTSLEHALQLHRIIRDHDVLIVGESGTGKERIAHAVLEGTLGASPDTGPAPRAALNAAAIPESLLESELFGHVKGAFTGATDTRRGRIRAAHGGCFFLDEVGDVPLTTQVKLLRVIETNHVSPLGSDAGHHVDVRYVSATHRPLEEMIETGQFRQDLYQRLAGTVIVVPPLRDRPDDIAEIGLHFVARHAPEGAGVNHAAIDRWLGSAEARSHRWPGNVRELENALRNLMLGLPPRLLTSDAPRIPELPHRIEQGSAPLADVEQWYIERQVRAAEGNLTEAARRLGINRATVKRRLHEQRARPRSV